MLFPILVSSLSKDGVLSVTAPRSAPALSTTATNAPISGFKKTRGNAIEDEVFNPQTTQVLFFFQDFFLKNTKIL